MENNIDDLRHIRSMMERSTKFLSLSGMAGVSAGVFAFFGAVLAYFIIHKGLAFTPYPELDLLVVAVLVLCGASTFAFYFSMRKSKKNNAKFWMPATRQILQDFLLPMSVGGAFCLILIYNHNSHLIAAAMLIFYGLALINAGARTYRDIRILGACEIVLGLLASIFTYNGLIFWTIGFGALHILYGIIVYYKYDAKPTKFD